MTSIAHQLDSIRSQFPSLARSINGIPAVYLDGPAGTQVPQRVVDCIANSMLHHNANRSGRFVTSREVDEQMSHSHRVFADFLGASSPDSIAFGPNMTSLTLQFSRALAKEWKPGDRILVSSLDHDANFTPWVLAAKDAGVEVKTIGVRTSDATLDLDSLSDLITERTRLVAVTAASNAVGSLTPIREIANRVHAVGAELFVDAVHLAPHRSIDVTALDCDFLVCSAYKFFGPHIGVLYGRTERMQDLVAYKLRPAPDKLPGKWMTGTQNHACIAGAAAAVDYIASLSPIVDNGSNRRLRIMDAMEAISEYETQLVEQLIRGLAGIPAIRIFGITESDRMSERAPTVSIQVDGRKSIEVAQYLGENGVFAWHGNYYALPLTLALGTEPDGMVRLGCMHYNTPKEIDRTLDLLKKYVSVA
ncbi:MAG: cysteine desulfurase-like protein [Planctomycetota bacterium]|nr:cysteine desulfurase-like protein [Planctomycetota bacterium]